MRSNRGAPGIDGESIQAIEERGVEKFLCEIQVEARAGQHTFPGETSIHTESRWEAAAIGDTDGSGSNGADGGEVGDRADL